MWRRRRFLRSFSRKNKERVTALLCCNMLGEKYKPFIIRKSAKPRCFRGVDVSKLVKYMSQNSAWMTSELFSFWLKDLNKKMMMEKRKILLLVDNAACHNSGLELELSNVEVVFLPKNTTSIMQPLDMGIIQATKAHYKSNMSREVIKELDKCETATALELSKRLTLLKGIEFFVQAWDSISDATISNCWRKSGLCYGPEQEEVVENIDIPEQFQDVFEEWVKCDEALETCQSEFLSEDQIVADIQSKYIDNEESEDEEIEVQDRPILSSEALTYIDGLKKYLMQESSSEVSSSDLLALERIKRRVVSNIDYKPKQSSIEKFFHRGIAEFSSYRLVTNIGYCDYFTLVPR